MGVLFSRFRKKQTTIEILEGIDKDINRLQRNRKVNQDRQKQIVASLLIYSIVVYIFAAVIFFLVYFPDTWQLRFLYGLPLLIFPFLIWGIKKLLHWYFVKRISSNDLALLELRERKKQILEDVMETETYKRAREILEKFDPVRLRKLQIDSPEAGTHVTVTGTPGTVIQQRTVRTTQHVRGVSSIPSRMPVPSSPSPGPLAIRPSPGPLATRPSPGPLATRPRQPVSPFTPTHAAPQTQVRAMSQPRTPFPSQPVLRGGFAAVPPGLPMPRSVLPRERGTVDKFMDYLVGDGPENRYALICQHCYSHNGMALKEEFEYLSFRCCYCYNLNPAKKQRPVAPKLEFFAPLSSKKGPPAGGPPSNEESDDDDVDKEDDDYSDVDSLESDTSAGISPVQSVNTPVASASASSASSPRPDSSQAVVVPKPTETGSSKLHRVKGPRPSEVRGSRPDDTRGPVAVVANSSAPTVNLRSKQTEGQKPQTTGSQAPSMRDDNQVPRLPSGHTAKVIRSEASGELKDLSHTGRVASNEGQNLPGAVQDKKLSELTVGSKDIPGDKKSLAKPTSQTLSAGLEADQRGSPTANINTTQAEDTSSSEHANSGLSQTQNVNTSMADTHTSGGASVTT